jgi:high-affinity iron transporter
MLSHFLIALRETCEAARVVGIVVGCLIKNGYTRYQWTVYSALFAGFLGSLVSAFLFFYLSSFFKSEAAEKIFESTTVLVGAVFLITTVLWLHKYRTAPRYLEKQVETKLLRPYPKIAIFGLIATAVLREGVEMVIFLNAAVADKDVLNAVSIVGGIAAATALGYCVFLTSLKIHLKHFFAITNILLVLFAISLIVRSVHEMVEL